jgi:general secretion pathway protein B
MSYILDALRKADAQRQRTRLPGLHAQGPNAATSDRPSRWWRSPLAWALGSGLVIAAVVLAWTASQQPVAGPVHAPVAAEARQAAPTPPVSPVQTPATVVAAASPVSATPPAPATAIQPAPPPPVPERRAPTRAVRSTPDRLASPPVRAASAPAPAASASASASSRPASAPAPAAKPAASAAPPADSNSTSAPAGAPKLAITGGVYSANAAQRLLIVGGQVFNEGSEVAPGVVLEQVRPNQALLNFKGQRYTVRY